MAASERKAGCGGPPLARWPHTCYELNYMFLESLVEHMNSVSLRCQNMSFPEKQAREAWASRGDQNGEEEGDEDEKEPALVERV